VITALRISIDVFDELRGWPAIQEWCTQEELNL
jgi:hypothetical protein